MDNLHYVTNNWSRFRSEEALTNFLETISNNNNDIFEVFDNLKKQRPRECTQRSSCGTIPMTKLRKMMKPEVS